LTPNFCFLSCAIPHPCGVKDINKWNVLNEMATSLEEAATMLQIKR
jgi:hypothetical protein